MQRPDTDSFHAKWGRPMNETFHEFCGRVRIFSDFSEPELDELLRITNRVRIKKGQLLCKEGGDGDSMFVIREGVVRVVGKTAMGGIVPLARLSEGHVVGEMALIDESPRSATLEAESDVVVYTIRRSDFQVLKEELNPVAFKLIRALGREACERLRDANVQIQHYLHNPAELFVPDVLSGMEPPKETKKLTQTFLRFFMKN